MGTGHGFPFALPIQVPVRYGYSSRSVTGIRVKMLIPSGGRHYGKRSTWSRVLEVVIPLCCLVFLDLLDLSWIVAACALPPKDKGVEGGSSDLKLDIYDPLYLHPQDIGSQLVTFKLEGTENYKVWSAAVQLALHTRNKIGFITGKCVRNENEGPLQQQWDRCNAVVLSWLLGCVSPELYKGQVFCKNSKNVWDELKETYDKQDGSVIYNLHHKIYTLTQSGMSLSEYYHECNSLWRQFDSLVDLPACVCEGSDKLKKHAQLLRLMQFLMGLDDVYGSVRSMILTSDPIPDVKSAFATLSRDESHRNSNMVSNTSKSGPTAFAARSGSNNWNSNRSNNNTGNNNWISNRNTSNVGSTSNSNNRRFGRVSNLVCKHCNMTGHTIERCFELVGYPPGFKKNVNNQNNSNNVSKGDDKFDHNKSASHTLTNDQYQRLMVLLSGTGDTSKGFASVAVSHPNGTIEHVKQIGNYVLGKNLIAKDVLVVPGYHVSLLSVHKLSRDNQVVVSFNDSKCLIQDSTQRLGHPADQVLVVLKHKIKDVNQTNSGPCDICHKAKQTREPFPLSNHKSKHLGQFSPKSDEPYDDGGVSAGIGSKPVPETSTQNPSDSTVEAVASETVDQTDKSDTIDVTGSTSSRKVSRENEYATEAYVSEGIQGTKLDNEEYESEGEDIESFGHLFGWTPEPAVGQTVRKSSRKTSLPIKYQDYMLDKKHKYGINTVINYSNLSIDNYVFATSINKIHEPTTYQEAVKDSRWIEAMNQEIEALNRNNTWEITDPPLPYTTPPPPQHKQAIGSKWVWKVKYKSNGDIERFKARVVAKGFNQKEGIDYDETFSPVVKIVTVRCVLSIAIKNKWSLFQLDINNAFLYGDLEEEVYMNLPEGFCDKNEKKVANWLSHSAQGVILFSFYVDDIIVTGNNIDEINKFKQFLSSKFLIKDLGKLKYFLGIEVVNIPEGICLTLRKYCTELLSEFGMLACKPCGIPIESNPDSKKLVSKFGDDEALTGITQYQKLVGKLIYLTMTRPDISYAVHCLSQVMHSPMKSHLRLAFRAKCKITRRSITGYSVFLGNNLVSWKSKKRSVVSRSSTEAEFRAMCNVCCEVIWIRKILTDLQVDTDLPIEMNYDNNSAIQISANPVLHERSKHFEIDLYFLREKIADGLIKPRKVKSEDNIADLFTKGLTISDHNLL
ncbi:putative RNA-directed DNA polymerase [Tanacetum coccineum]